MSQKNIKLSTGKKNITIEKYDFDLFEKEKKPYVIILNEVIQKTPPERMREVFLWIYLESLPSTWKPCKKNITQHFEISDRTYDRWMSWLNATNLIEYRQIRNDEGTFGKGQLIVLNGTNFKPSAVSNRTAKIDGTVVSRSKKVQNVQAHRTAKKPLNGETDRSVCDAHINTTVKKENNVVKKTETSVVPVFSCDQEIEDFIKLRATQRDITITQDILDQIIFWIVRDEDTSTIPRRINAALTLVVKKKWGIPHGWKGITTQSIKKKEEEQKRQKEDDEKYDALIGNKLFNALEAARTDEECNEGRKQCEALFAMLRGSNANRSTM